ncbi:hypothetical protein QUA81_03585 [Microcoleus sp. F6_B4]
MLNSPLKNQLASTAVTIIPNAINATVRGVLVTLCTPGIVTVPLEQCTATGKV